jgi:hypothetical protein
MMDFDKYPKSEQGGLWQQKDANSSNNRPSSKGHIVVTEEMLKTLVVLMRNRAWKQEGEYAERGPRISLSAWTNTITKGERTGERFLKIDSSVYYGDEYNYLFDDNAENPIEQTAPESAPAAAEDKDFPF